MFSKMESRGLTSESPLKIFFTSPENPIISTNIRKNTNKLCLSRVKAKKEKKKNLILIQRIIWFFSIHLKVARKDLMVTFMPNFGWKGQENPVSLLLIWYCTYPFLHVKFVLLNITLISWNIGFSLSYTYNCWS